MLLVKARAERQPLTGVVAHLRVINDELSAVHEPIAAKFQKLLHTLEGRSFQTFAENQHVTGIIQDTLNRLQLAVRCQREDCGKPARIRCKKPGRSKTGVFQFEHFEGSSTNHKGGNVFPSLELLPAPPDRRRKSRVEVQTIVKT